MRSIFCCAPNLILQDIESGNKRTALCGVKIYGFFLWFCLCVLIVCVDGIMHNNVVLSNNIKKKI